MAAARSSTSEIAQIVQNLATDYAQKTARHIKVLDSFLVFTLVVSALQFLYCALVGTFPFNSFLSGFISTIGVFVLTVSLRFQFTERKEFKDRPEYQAFGEYIACCIILFLSVLNFMG